MIPSSPVSFLVDGGYLAWVYGIQGSNINAWNVSKQKYNRKSGCLICLDSRNSVRKDREPSYKSGRAERREQRPEMQTKSESVHMFRSEIIAEDYGLRTVTIDGLEADDLLAIILYHKLIPTPCKVIGIDKDLSQISPELFRLEKHTGEPIGIPEFARKQAKTLQPHIRSSWHVLLCLTLLGDQSDSIPKLVPPRSLTEVAHLISRSERPFSTAVKWYGDAVNRNLGLAMLPCPYLFEEHIEEAAYAELADEVIAGRPMPKVKEAYLQIIQEALVN